MVVLSNSSNSVDDLGLHLLDSRYPLSVPFGSPPEAKVSPGTLDRFVGLYELTPNAIFAITREDNQLFAQLTGQTRVAIFPKSPREFFLKVVNAQISFETDSGGKVTGLTLHQNGADREAPRISRAAATQALDAFRQHIRSNTPSPGTQASLLRYINSLECGQPNYRDIEPGDGDVLTKTAAVERGIIGKMGALQSPKFKDVNTAGLDAYAATFANGRLEWVIAPLSDVR
ncbi:MAG TPA: DUF3471 domain-containing protein [Steroidobacteraceae bacterium]|nr:DUF3471 domain-containing protein [Steroidobacteraceae bacterium]